MKPPAIVLVVTLRWTFLKSAAWKGAPGGKRRSQNPVRQSAALALGEMNAYAAIPWLKQALNDSPEVAFGAAKALTKLGDSSGRDVLIAVMAGERVRTRPVS